MGVAIDLTGQKFGRLTVIERTDQRDGCGSVIWKCLCDCGKTTTVSAGRLRLKKRPTQSCGCLQKEIASNLNKVDLTGRKFGKLTVLKALKKRTLWGGILWKCKCDCGGTINVPTNSLTMGNTKSCGCLWKESNQNNIVDIKGQKFGLLTALKLTKKRSVSRSAVWKCRCKCGNIAYVSQNDLAMGNKKNCGCQNPFVIAGRRYGKLVAVKPTATNDKHNSSVVWECKCDCGNTAYFFASSLHKDSKTNCGCVDRNDIAGQRFGYLTVLEKTDKFENRSPVWKCLCACEKYYVYATISQLKTGEVFSCGCLKDFNDITGKRYGKPTIPLYGNYKRKKPQNR